MTAVEFVIILPVMLVFFAAIVEGSRLYWNYQSAVTGVRDAARLIARTTNSDICDTAGPSTDLGRALAEATIFATMTNDGGQTLFPTGVSISGVTARPFCITTTGFSTPLRNAITPTVEVRAEVRIELPFGTLFEFFGARDNTFMETEIVDRSRIYGI